MKKFKILIDHLSDWTPYYITENIVATEKYLAEDACEANSCYVINLSKQFDYLSVGYYCSLLAEAKTDKIIPTVSTINDLHYFKQYQLLDIPLSVNFSKQIEKVYLNEEALKFKIFFGSTVCPEFRPLGKKIFEHYMAPIIEITLKKLETQWFIDHLDLGNLANLDDQEQTAFADALDQFSKKVWRLPKAKKQYRYELAILYNEDEKMGPSNKKAINNFIKAGNQLGIDVDLITSKDYLKIAEYDALFIRETTAINHYTYQFAKKAQTQGLVVIDSPEAIIKCTNKVFLHNLFAKHNIPAPESKLLFRERNIDIKKLIDELGLPVILKIPDESFSKGVKKADSMQELEDTINNFFQYSSVIIAQKYYFTEYDWRIGIINNRPIYACKYYMSKNHWQIYNYQKNKISSGKSESFGIQQVPKEIIKTSLKASRLIGNDFYGVDVKLVDNQPLIIEINDNPSIDAGYEDSYLGDELYRIIMDEFARRLDIKKMHPC